MAANAIVVQRYINNAALNVANNVAGTYVDAGGAFTVTLTTLAGDQVHISVQGIVKKNVASSGAVVVDRSGTKLPAVTINGSVYVAAADTADFIPFCFEYWDAPAAGTYTYKPQIYTSDNNGANIGGGNNMQFLVEVWR